MLKRERPWIKHDGTRMRVQDMDSDHLNNAILMIERRLKGVQGSAGRWRREAMDYHVAMYGRLLEERTRRRNGYGLVITIVIIVLFTIGYVSMQHG